MACVLPFSPLRPRQLAALAFGSLSRAPFHLCITNALHTPKRSSGCRACPPGGCGGSDGNDWACGRPWRASVGWARRSLSPRWPHAGGRGGFCDDVFGAGRWFWSLRHGHLVWGAADPACRRAKGVPTCATPGARAARSSRRRSRSQVSGPDSVGHRLESSFPAPGWTTCWT